MWASPWLKLVVDGEYPAMRTRLAAHSALQLVHDGQRVPDNGCWDFPTEGPSATANPPAPASAAAVKKSPRAWTQPPGWELGLPTERSRATARAIRSAGARSQTRVGRGRSIWFVKPIIASIRTIHGPARLQSARGLPRRLHPLKGDMARGMAVTPGPPLWSVRVTNNLRVVFGFEGTGGRGH